MPEFWEELPQASFRGVTFLIESTTTSGGRKTATHEFVNTDKRSVEDLGKSLKIFKFVGYTTAHGLVTPNFSTSKYIKNKNDLITALELGGIGILSHPFFGSSIQVVSTKYTVTENFRESGLAKFQLIFERVAAEPPLIVTRTTQASIATNAVTSFNLLGQDLENDFEVSTINNFQSSELLFGDIALDFDDASETFIQGNTGVNIFQTPDLSIPQIFNAVLAKINNFKSAIRDFTNNIRTFILAPSRLVNSVRGIFTALVDLSSTPQFAVTMLQKLYDFGVGLPEELLLTAERIERNLNQVSTFNLIRAGALIESYRQTALIVFNDIRELDTLNNLLNNQFNRVIVDIKNPSTYTQLLLLRNLTSEFLDNQRLNVREIINIETANIPVQKLAYQYYGDLSQYERIINLNKIKNVSFTAGTVEIFTESPENIS